MSPRRSNSANVSPCFRTCGGFSLCAAVAATYHWSPIWTLASMPFSLVDCLPGHLFAVDREVGVRHRGGGKALLELLAAAPAVEAFTRPGGSDRFGLVVHDETRDAILDDLGHRT